MYDINYCGSIAKLKKAMAFLKVSLSEKVKCGTVNI